jgi:large subunit ribosomal protein L14e
MALIEEGRVCIKKSGRDAGSKAVVTKVIDDNFVSIITEGRPRERRCNVRHLEFLNEKTDAKDPSKAAAYLGINEKQKPSPQQKKAQK